MAKRASEAIDVRNVPELARLADEVARTGRPRLLRSGDVDVAVVVPACRRIGRRRARPLTGAQRDAILATAGSWKGLVDAERLKRDLKEAQPVKR